MRKALVAPLTVLAAGAVAVPAQGAVTGLTVTGDDGAPVAIATGMTLRNMSPTVGVNMAAGGGYFTIVVNGPDGVPALSRSCTSSSPGTPVDYRGNGAYTVTVTSYGSKDYSCKTPVGAPLSATFNLGSSVALSGPAKRVLIRKLGSFSIVPVPLGISLNPGALSTEIKYALNGAVGPDGGISGPTQDGYVDSTTGLVPLNIRKPGRYVAVARQKAYATPSGNFFTPWSAPVTIQAVVPFEVSTLSFIDAVGPRFSVRGYMQDDAMIGSRVTVSIARGSKGGKYKRIGKPKVMSNRSFKVNFNQRRKGTYRFKVSYKGNSQVVGGYMVRKMKIRTILR